MVKKLPSFQSLAGQFIVSAHSSSGQFFDKAVVFVTRHSAENGAEGYIINHPLMTLSPKEIFKDRNINHLGADFHLMKGGPVDLDHGSVLHTDDYHALDTHPLMHHLALTETQQVLDDIEKSIGATKILSSCWQGCLGPQSVGRRDNG